MENGTIKSFDQSRGHGWIVPNNGMSDLFVHHRNIVGYDNRTLPIGAMVTYESRFVNEVGLEAFNVSLSE